MRQQSQMMARLYIESKIKTEVIGNPVTVTVRVVHLHGLQSLVVILSGRNGSRATRTIIHIERHTVTTGKLIVSHQLEVMRFVILRRIPVSTIDRAGYARVILAQEVREYLAEIGVERLDDIIGRTDLIVRKPDDGIRKHQLISFDKLLARVDNEAAIRHVTDQQHGIDHVKDVEMLHAAAEAVENQKEISLEYTIANTDRACGAMLSGVIAAKYGEKGLPEHTLNVKFKGSAGQSFGAFLVPGVNFKLEGEANDYLGKGLSGGRIAVLPPVRSNFEAEKNTIAGNTLLYGATSGEVYINGRAGERFAVRNSGATAVVEGVGDHCCEYMTGGRVVVLGQTGRNFAAGMSGGVAYVWNRDGNFDYFCNMEMVELSLIEEASYRKELHELICQHYLYTGSKLARTMLDDWPRYADQFIQVVPIEYKKVLQEEQMQKLQQKIAEMQRDY